MASLPQQGQTTGTNPRRGASLFWGLALVVAGLAILTVTVGLVRNPGGAVYGTAFLVAGAAILASYPILHTHWWTLLAGPTLLGLGAVIVLPGGGSGAIFLAGIGAGFALVAVTSLRRWWAIIPAGTLLTLSVVSLIGGAMEGRLSGAVLFLGIGATFGVLALIRVHGKTMRWPLFPAAACALLAALIATSGPLAAIVWPAVLVAAGVFLLIRASTKRT
jgi:hypothetical protein